MSSVPAKQALSASPLAAPRSTGAPEIVIRDATPGDMEAVQRIYAYHVLQSTATFEEQPPDVQEMRSRLAQVQAQGTPWLVAEINGEIVGYCYAALYRPRVAYRYTLEDSIYLAEGQTGKGLGKALLAALLERCEQGPWRQMIAVIGGTNNVGSIALHRSLGFAHAGTQVATGYKFKQWIDVVFMQRALGEGSSTPPKA
ncbi:GNAT family N-acetyltransferase [Parapusillimonas granuli]|uniref:N-acetyltransferase family protein n=1 Tax=Parapusillimonas granuli TaxID=380911 RepID=A0A853FY40_9BURK|nr:GNAT family N-acetyltransferase [Parapusillimonas granuli]MBB5215206.1 phosphinothricin acetyltransferase [Parapusillimonas granuli]MEB2401794.1 GNAT family N-acetyltransferase [Alcaligenaceae bacterium]NYT49523.1 N-acetyltransferase family protein [Parapusillimonas granuli]